MMVFTDSIQYENLSSVIDYKAAYVLQYLSLAGRVDASPRIDNFFFQW